MDPLRTMLHLGLSLTQATLTRTLEVVQLVDTLVVAGADTESPEGRRAWPDEEVGDLGAGSAALRAHEAAPTGESTAGRATPAGAPTSPATTAAARTSHAATKKVATAKKAGTAKKASTAQRTGTAKKAPAKKTGTATATTDPSRTAGAATAPAGASTRGPEQMTLVEPPSGNEA